MRCGSPASLDDRACGAAPTYYRLTVVVYRRAAMSAAVALLTLAGAGCATFRTPDSDTDPRASAGVANEELAAAMADQYAPAEYVVGPEDLLVVTVHDLAEEESGPQELRVRVTQGGEISLPLIGAVEVAGRTIPDVETLLRDRYRAYIHEPRLSVLVGEYRSYRVSVLGHVERPGFYELQGQRSLLEVLNLAGGLGADAAMRVQITRRTRSGVRTHYVDLERVMRGGDMRFNVPVRAGDVIYVPEMDDEVLGRGAWGGIVS